MKLFVLTIVSCFNPALSFNNKETATPSSYTRACNFRHTPTTVKSIVQTIERHICSAKQRHVHRESTTCCLSVDHISYPIANAFL